MPICVRISCISGWTEKKKSLPLGLNSLSLLNVKRKEIGSTNSILGKVVCFLESYSHLSSLVSTAGNQEFYLGLKLPLILVLQTRHDFRPGGVFPFQALFFLIQQIFIEYLSCTRDLAVKSSLYSFGGSQTLNKYIFD